MNLAAAFEEGSGGGMKFGRAEFAEDRLVVQFFGLSDDDVVKFVRSEPITQSHALDLAYRAGQRLSDRLKSRGHQ